MKTPEDEAFEDIERRQGGFKAKREMAIDKQRAWTKKDLALDSLTRVCEIQQRLINQLIAMEQHSYARGYEDGMAAQAEVDIALNEMAVKSETI
jgi:tRNA 2-selenouridine synthase SelU